MVFTGCAVPEYFGEDTKGLFAEISLSVKSSIAGESLEGSQEDGLDEPQANGDDFIIADFDIKSVTDDVRQEMGVFDKTGPVNQGIFDTTDPTDYLEAESPIEDSSPLIALAIYGGTSTGTSTNRTYVPVSPIAETYLLNRATAEGISPALGTVPEILRVGYTLEHGVEAVTANDKRIAEVISDWKAQGWLASSHADVQKTTIGDKSYDSFTVCNNVINELTSTLNAAGYDTALIDTSLGFVEQAEEASTVDADYLLILRMNGTGGSYCLIPEGTDALEEPVNIESGDITASSNLAQQLMAELADVHNVVTDSETTESVSKVKNEVILNFTVTPSIILTIDAMSNADSIATPDSIASYCNAITRAFQVIEPID